MLILIGTVQKRGWLVPRDLLYVAVVLLIPAISSGVSRGTEPFSEQFTRYANNTLQARCDWDCFWPIGMGSCAPH